MHSHGVCSRTEGGIRWCPHFSARSCSWAQGRHLLEEAVQLLFLKLDFGDGFASLQLDAITPTLLGVEAFSDTPVPTPDLLGLVLLLTWSSSSSWHRDIPVLSCSHTRVQGCAHKEGEVPAPCPASHPCFSAVSQTHQFQVSKSAP